MKTFTESDKLYSNISEPKIPSKLNYEIISSDVKIQQEYIQYKINPDIEEKAFEIQIPEDFKVN